jgi:hypothetical protein
MSGGQTAERVTKSILSAHVNYTSYTFPAIDSYMHVSIPPQTSEVPQINTISDHHPNP